jgi:transcriptional regulator with XRE-family HTH domain
MVNLIIRRTEVLDIGGQILQARRLRGRNQQWLANQIGISYQQLQKMEIGVNRVPASRLAFIAKVLELPITFFYEADDFQLSAEDGLMFRSYAKLSETDRTAVRRIVQSFGEAR